MDLIFLHGTAAAGKLTTARALEAFSATRSSITTWWSTR